MFYRNFILVFCLCSAAMYGQVTEGLIASYDFKGNLNDGQGKNHGKGVGYSYVDDRFSNSRSAVFLHGSEGSYITLGTSKDLKPRAGTISVWVNIEIPMFSGKGFSINPIILTKNDTLDDFFESYTIVYDYSFKKIVVSSSTSELKQITLHSLQEFSLNSWHHLVLSYDDDFLALYVDGELQARIAKNFTSRFLDTDSVMLGNSANDKNQRFLCGSIDDLAFYNRVLTPSEVLNLYSEKDPNQFHNILVWSFRGAMILLVLFFVFWLLIKRYRKELERQKEEHRINARLNELETKAIRTQMNPHFIFNALNTLQRFILEEDIANSNLYLTRFSKLLRKLIESSVSDSIALSEEIDILTSYTELEMLRFERSFEFTITCEVPDRNKVYVPFMLVQPFVENAIWHGLLPKEGERFLKIWFTELDHNSILCVVEDNGVGRVQKSEQHANPLKKRSLALDFIKQRLELLKKSTGINCAFKLIDKLDENNIKKGTRVEIIIPKLNYYDTRSDN